MDISIRKRRFRTYHNNRSLISLALAITLAGLSLTANAGKITSVLSDTGAEGFGGWNLGNVEVILNGTQGAIGDTDTSWFDEETGAYNFAIDSDFSYEGLVDDGAGTMMGIALAKDWPVGEPSGIKVINDDLRVKDPKPQNCIMATSYLAEHFLDSEEPQQVTCSSGFQTHKRYKLAMLPATVDGMGSESVDLVFNVEDEAGTRDYQVFQKINNWTDGRLEGFKIQVGFGVGTAFQTTTEAGVALDDLYLTVPSDIWADTQLANFSEGLFGPFDDHTETLGFFDPDQRAGFFIDEYDAQLATDTLTATRTLGSDYAEVPPGAAVANQFGAWVPNSMLPYGVFFDDDGNPETDAELLAWYGYNPALINIDGTVGGLGWMSGSQGSEENPAAFSEIPAEDIEEMGENLAFTMDVIDDLVNVGLNYIVTIGDVDNFPAAANGTFTIRITPTADTSGALAPDYVGVDPVPWLLFSSSDADVLLEPKDEFVVGSLLTARVGDADLNMDTELAETTNVNVVTSTGLVIDDLLLTELGENRGVFAATLPDEFSNVPVGTVVTISYVDANTGNGASDIKTSSSVAIAEIVPILSDVEITDFSVPETIINGRSRNLKVSILNTKDAEEAASGKVFVTGTDGSEFEGEFNDLKVNGKMKFRFRWNAQLEVPDENGEQKVEWTATVLVNDQVVDEESASTVIEAKVGKNSRR